VGLTKTLPFNVAGDLTFDTDKIEVAGGGAKLKLEYSLISGFSEDFADDTDHVYDSAKAEFTGGAIQQKDQTPASSVKGAVFTGNANPIVNEANLSWSKTAGSLIATLHGLPTIVSGKLVCAGAQGVSYAHTTTAIETHKFRYTPTYTGAPPSNVNMITVYNGTNNNDRYAVSNSPSGNNIRIGMYDNTGASIVGVATTVGSFSPTAGTTYEIEVVVNSTAGTIRIFVDGNLIGTLTPGAWARGGIASKVILGATTIIYNTAQASFSDYIGFSDAQHSASYTPAGYVVAPTIYAESSDTLPVFTYAGPGLLRAASPPTTTETGAPRYLVQGKYWDGSAWVDSDGSYAQATSKANILANIASFPSTGQSQITLKVIFGASNTISSVSQLDFFVQGELYPTDNPIVYVTEFTKVDGLFDVFTSDFDFAGSDTVKFLLVMHDTSSAVAEPMYWDGAAWSVSDGTYAQSNTATEIQTNQSSLSLVDGTYLRVYAFLHSEDGLTSPTLNSIVFDYNFFASPPLFNKCIVFGFLNEINGDYLTGKVTISNLTPFYYDDALIPKSQVSVDADAKGYWEVELIETQSASKSYKFEIEYGDPIALKVTYSAVVIPNQDSAALSSLIP